MAFSRPPAQALVAFQRPEMKFGGLDELKAQIAADCATAREALADGTVAGLSYSVRHFLRWTTRPFPEASCQWVE